MEDDTACCMWNDRIDSGYHCLALASAFLCGSSAWGLFIGGYFIFPHSTRKRGYLMIIPIFFLILTTLFSFLSVARVRIDNIQCLAKMRRRVFPIQGEA